MNGDAPEAIASVSSGAEAAIPPKITKQKIARRNKLKSKSTLLLAIPDEHLLKFHGIKDAKTLWEVIKTRFQKLISQLEIHGEVISKEDANLKLLRSLPSAWNTYTLIMQNKSNLDTLNLEQIDTNDLEEMDPKWQVVMLTMRVKRFIKKTGRNLNFNGKETIGFDKTKVECYNCHRRGHFARECKALRNQGNKNGDNTRRVVPMETLPNALVVTDGMGYDWSYQAEEGPTDFALMALSSLGSSNSDTEVRDNSITELKNQLEESLKEKDDLKLKFEKFGTSSKNLTNLINSQISPKYKTGLGYDSQLNERNLNNIHMNKSEVFESASDSSVNESEEDNNQVNDRYKAGEGYHTVPPPYTGNFMPLRPDLSFVGLDDSVFNSAMSETVTSVHETKTSASKTSKESMKNLKTVRSSAPLIEEWESGSNDDFAIKSGQVPVNTAKQSSPRAAASISTARPVNTVNRVLVTKPLNKTPYELLIGRSPNLDCMRPFGCPITILNTLDHLSKFEGKANEGFLVGYSINNKALRSSDDKDADKVPGKGDEGVSKGSGIDDHERTDSSTQYVNTAGPSINTANTNINTGSLYINIVGSNDPIVSPIHTTRVPKDHPKEQIIGDLNLATQTRRMINFSEEKDMVKQKDDGIFISQDKYVANILKKFNFTTVKTASTLMELNKALIKDAEAEDVDVHLYRSMIGSLIYLTASRPDIMFAVCACARFQVTPKTSYLYFVKRIFRYLKGQPKLGLWYPRDSPFNLEAFSDSDYTGASLDRKSTTGGCPFLRKRLISWQYKKQTIVANSITEAEYVTAANCCGQ
nr:uncharacterized mitochondrial protein AtMg00810-like [Tanacetum cinerariifolium]